MKEPIRRLVIGPDAMLELGRRIGAALRGGECLALNGELGAGKTTLVQGIAQGLSIRDPVVSPTFVLLREYEGRLRLCHFDAYRLAGPDELLALGFAEIQADRLTVCVVEWACRVAPLLQAAAIQVDLEHAGEDARRLTIRLCGCETGMSRDWLSRIVDSLPGSAETADLSPQGKGRSCDGS